MELDKIGSTLSRSLRFGLPSPSDLVARARLPLGLEAFAPALVMPSGPAFFYHIGKCVAGRRVFLVGLDVGIKQGLFVAGSQADDVFAFQPRVAGPPPPLRFGLKNLMILGERRFHFRHSLFTDSAVQGFLARGVDAVLVTVAGACRDVWEYVRPGGTVVVTGGEWVTTEVKALTGRETLHFPRVPNVVIVRKNRER